MYSGIGTPSYSVAIQCVGFSDQKLGGNVMARDVDLALIYLVSKDSFRNIKLTEQGMSIISFDFSTT